MSHSVTYNRYGGLKKTYWNHKAGFVSPSASKLLFDVHISSMIDDARYE